MTYMLGATGAAAVGRVWDSQIEASQEMSLKPRDTKFTDPAYFPSNVFPLID